MCSNVDISAEKSWQIITRRKETQAKNMQKTKTPVTSNVIEVEDYDVNNDNMSENPTPSTSSTLPFILQGKFFKVTSKSVGQKIIAQCTNCPKIIRGSRTSTGNFVSHYKRLHPQLIKKIKLNRLNNKKRLKTDRQQNIVTTLTTFQKKSTVAAKQVHDLILTYLIEEMRPLSTVYKPSFRNLICGLVGYNEPDKFVPGKHIVRSKINNLYEIKKIQLQVFLEKQTYICLTTDIWSCHNKSYLGMTAHFIVNTFERKSYMLACKRILYNHTYKNIALLMHHILTEFNIDVSKVTHVITDNATNFGKTFRCFGVTQLENSDLTQSVEEENEDTIDEDSDIEVDNFENILRNPDIIENDNLFTDELGNEIILPPQLTCCSHLLNLIVTTDCKKILENPSNVTLKKIYHSTFAKLSAFWNILSHNTIVSDICIKECGCKFPVPIITRWNSQYYAVKKILAYKSKLNTVFEKLKLQKLKNNEIEFLEEFILIMSPLATSIDILQGKQMSFLGLVAPTLIVLRNKLKNCSHLTYCNPLATGIILNLEKRFKHVFEFDHSNSRIYILSAISFPRFKLNWIPEAYVELCKDLFLKEIQYLYSKNITIVEKSTFNSSGEEDFFRNLDKKNENNNQTIFSGKIEALSYLECESKELQSLTNFPNVKMVFMKYNTSLSSSAPVERLFSMAQQITIPRRNQLSDMTFEKLLFLRNLKLDNLK